jgi:hypothetical protein
MVGGAACARDSDSSECQSLTAAIRDRDDYQEAYESILSKCSSKHAPWFISPGARMVYCVCIVYCVCVLCVCVSCRVDTSQSQVVP